MVRARTIMDRWKIRSLAAAAAQLFTKGGSFSLVLDQFVGSNFGSLAIQDLFDQRVIGPRSSA